MSRSAHRGSGKQWPAPAQHVELGVRQVVHVPAPEGGRRGRVELAVPEAHRARGASRDRRPAAATAARGRGAGRPARRGRRRPWPAAIASSRTGHGVELGQAHRVAAGRELLAGQLEGRAGRARGTAASSAAVASAPISVAISTRSRCPSWAAGEHRRLRVGRSTGSEPGRDPDRADPRRRTAAAIPSAGTRTGRPGEHGELRRGPAGRPARRRRRRTMPTVPSGCGELWPNPGRSTATSRTPSRAARPSSGCRARRESGVPCTYTTGRPPGAPTSSAARVRPSGSGQPGVVRSRPPVGQRRKMAAVIPVVTPEEMAAIDAAAPEPVEVLIERAGAAVARAALDLLGGTYGRRVVVVAGKGNNGADGRAAAGRLRRRGVRVVEIDAADAASDLPAARPADRRRLRHRVPRRVRARAGPPGHAGARGRHPVRRRRPHRAGRRRDRSPPTAPSPSPRSSPASLLGDGPELAGEVTVADIGLDTSTGDAPTSSSRPTSPRWLPDAAARDATSGRPPCGSSPARPA